MNLRNEKRLTGLSSNILIVAFRVVRHYLSDVVDWESKGGGRRKDAEIQDKYMW